MTNSRGNETILTLLRIECHHFAKDGNFHLKNCLNAVRTAFIISVSESAF